MVRVYGEGLGSIYFVGFVSGRFASGEVGGLVGGWVGG